MLGTTIGSIIIALILGGVIILLNMILGFGGVPSYL
jgi:hypothetical protein